jgi:hypothetical protein
MPSKTAKQRRAMRAAAAGHSTLGIPPSVGKEYVAADKRATRKKSKAKKRARK